MKRRMQQTPCSAVVLPACDAGSRRGCTGHSVAGSVAVVNDYLFRGLSQTNRKPAVQPGIEYDHASGWYIGAWGSNVSWLSDASTSAAPISSSVELDFYTGLPRQLSVPTGAMTSGFTSTTTRAPIRLDSPAPIPPRATPRLGFKGISLKYSHAFTNLFGFADSKHSGYVDLSYSVRIQSRLDLGCARRATRM